MKEMQVKIPDTVVWEDLIQMIQDNSVYIDPIKLMKIIEEQGWVRVL